MKFSKMPFLRLVVCLSAGIALQRLYPSEVWRYVSLVVCSLSVLFSLRKRRYGQLRYGDGVVLLCVTLLMGLYLEARELRARCEDPQFSGAVLVEVCDSPIEKPKSVQLLTRVADSLMANCRMMIYVSKDSGSLSLREGDYLLIDSGCFEKGVREKSGSDTYLQSKGIALSAFVPKRGWRKVGRDDTFSVVRMSHKAQKSLVSVFSDYGIEGDELAVLSALTVGDKTLLDKDLRNSYAVAGASHILAVSGLHVGVIYWVFTMLLSQVLRGEERDKLRSVIALLALWSYAFVTGLTPSVVRASIMLSMIAFAKMIDRKPQTMNNVFASAFLMLIYRPQYLFDVGFQLSYVAVISILLFQKPIYNTVVCGNKMVDKCWSLLSVTLAAQLGTMPLTLYYFHQFSNYFWLSGFVVIPLSTLLIYGSMTLWFVQWSTILSISLAFVLRWGARAMNVAVGWVESWFGAVIQYVSYTKADLLFAYLLLSALYFYVRKDTFIRYITLLSVLFLYALFQTINKIFFVI